tara:strand:- start:413 stop:655 length:243 start_codon:yes stop_codon:yes gene_type:complete
MHTTRTHFQNGYGMSMALIEGCLEIAILYDGYLIYDSPIADVGEFAARLTEGVGDVVRGATLSDIVQIAEILKASPPRET